MKDIDRLVDQFVQFLNRNGLKPLLAENLSEELRITSAQADDFVEWQIRPAASNPWVAEIEEMIGMTFPTLYRSLIRRYRFAELQVGPISFFGNTGGAVQYDLKKRMFADQYLSPVLVQNKFLHIGHPYVGDYDPICFDTRKGHNGDAPIVRLDHEDILIRDGRITLKEEIAPSFENFIERTIAGQFTS